MKECIHAITIKLHQLECTNCSIYNSLCDDNENCYYKQLQRAQKVLDEIKAIIEQTGIIGGANDKL